MKTTEKMPRFKIHYNKSKPLDLTILEKQYIQTEDDKKNDYNPFHIKQFQNFQPIYPLYFDMNEQNYNSICLNHRYHIIDLETVLDTSDVSICTKPIFIKYSPLLDPIRYMIGKYDINNPNFHNLPSLTSTDCDKKIAYYNNTAYVDCFFSFLSSQLLHTHNFKHGIDFYGNYSAVQEKFKMNVSDDIEYLNSSNYFLNNAGKNFVITNHESISYFNSNNSRGNKMKINISNSTNVHNLSNISVIDIATDNTNTEFDNENIEQVYLKNNTEKSESTNEEDEEDDVSDTETDTTETSESGSESSEETDENEQDEETEETIDSDDDNVEPTIHAYINNFPVQMICLEKCDGTLDDLFENNEIDAENGASALFQIIMILIAYQKAFHMTHNDLHTNNIMYVHTNEDYLYYRFNKINYKVPTYGKIFKIIDFGRSIYKYNGKLFCSDSFAQGGDAATQYNFEPFYNQNKPLIEPNYSFDLCRLGCSIYDFIIDDDTDTKEMDELQKTILRWCQDDAGKSVLYKKNGEERYPNFKLYKMIARNVHAHTPQAQLSYPLFSKFSMKNSKNVVGEFMDLDKLPSYV